MGNMILRLAMNGFLSFLSLFTMRHNVCTRVLRQWLEDLPLQKLIKSVGNNRSDSQVSLF